MLTLRAKAYCSSGSVV